MNVSDAIKNITSQEEKTKRNPARRFFHIAGNALMILTAIALCSWIVGRFISDRYEWSQWITWTPTPIAIGLAVAGLFGALTSNGSPKRQRFRVFSWLAILFLFLVYFTAIEHHMFTRCKINEPGFRILHWNAAAADVSAAQTIVDVNPDIVLFTHPRRIPWQKPIQQWLGPTDRNPITTIYPFAILTKFPILERRTVIASEQHYAVFVRIDTTEPLGRTLSFLLVDLPSDPEQSRMETARQIRQWLDEADMPEPDIYAGDFNITRGSASLKVIAPHHTHAYELAGSGYSATYPRDKPWLHIDHMLVNDSITPIAYCIRDTGTSTHRMQLLLLEEPDNK